MVQNGCEPFALKAMLEICKESSDFFVHICEVLFAFFFFVSFLKISFYNKEASELQQW